MKVCHLLWSFARGGTECMLVDIANEQVKDNEVCIVVVNDCIDLDLRQTLDARIQFVQVGRPCGSHNPWYILKMNWKIDRLHPDIVHVHMTGMRRYYKLRIPVVFTAHSNMIGKDDCKYQKIFCISNIVQKTCIKLGAKNTCVVYNGIHSEKISSNDVVKRELHDPVRIVCVGRLHLVKGQQILLEAFRILVNERGVSHIHLDLIGEGEMRRDLSQFIERENLSGIVSLLGSKPREFIYPRLKDYDLFIIPSINEGFGLTLAEACAAKISVISTDLEGPMEVIDFGKYGRDFKCGNPVSLADEIEDFIRKGVNVKQVEAAYQYIKANFDVKMTARRYVVEYGKIQ